MSSKSLLFYTIVFSLYSLVVRAQYIIGGPLVDDKVPKVTSQDLDDQLDHLAFKITKNAYTESEKAKAIFTWIATHIDYDNELRYNTSLQKSIYVSEESVITQVLQRKKALCGGFAFLFERLCNTVNIDAKVIHGYTKTPGLRRKHNKVHHTWNAVKINGNWKLLDITYAKSHSATKEINMQWYHMEPKYFIKTHLPKESKWTLLGYSMSLKDFDSTK